MANPFWADLYKVFGYAFRPDPISRKSNSRTIDGAGVTQPDAIPDIRSDNYWGGGSKGSMRLRETNDYIDMAGVTGRQTRYKEYERLMYVSEIDSALTIYADESCIAGNTNIPTPFGNFTIKELAETKKPDEKFLVYSFDMASKDYTLGWAYHPRLVGQAQTIKILLDNGEKLTLTPDHKLLTRDAMWKMAGNMEVGEELMPFYRKKATGYSGCKTHQFPRIFTLNEGWKHERQLVDEWRLGKKLDRYKEFEMVNRRVKGGLTCRQISDNMGKEWNTCQGILNREGFSYMELKRLYTNHEDRRRIIGITEGETIDVYDMSVETHENFATDHCIVHNCQKGNNKHMFDITCKNQAVKKEAEFLFFKLLKIDRKIWNMAKKLYQMGDLFIENVIDPHNPSAGILKINILPVDSVYRIETTKGKLIEFQQSKDGPDYQSLSHVEVEKATEQDLAGSTALRFSPEQIIHMRIGDERKAFYPYGVSLIEPARGPANQLKLMEDAMVVYRLCLVGDTRIRTTEGYQLIKDLQEGDSVYSFTQAGLVPTKVSKWVSNGIKDVFRVRTKHVEITGTATHPILVNRDGVIQYVDIKDLVVGKDKFLMTTHESSVDMPIPVFDVDVWAKLSIDDQTVLRNAKFKNKSQLLRQCYDFGRAKQFLYAQGKALPLFRAEKICEVFGIDKKKLILVNKNQRNSERINLPSHVDEEFARLFGFLHGDGFMHNNNQFGFACGNDALVNGHYSAILSKYFGKVRFEQDKRKSNGIGKYVVDSTIGCSVLTRLGYINNHRINRIPSWVFLAHKNIRRAFVEGFSNADGCERLTKKGTWFSTIELCNQNMVRDIKELWSSIGLCSGQLKTRKRKGGHEIELGRKMPNTISYGVTISDCILPNEENVISVVAAGQEEVFDITVENPEHNFIANGIPVHNTRAPERRVYYIDMGNVPPNKAEAFMDRIKDQLRKKKTYSGRGGQTAGASSVEERWHAPAADEDIFLPTRPNSQTRIETLPGAQNLGDIDDAIYFRNKLLIALNLPKNYLAPDDPSVTSKTLSSQNVMFAKLVERLQMSLTDGMMELLERHLRLRGFPQDTYDDVEILFTPPSAYKETSEQEVLTSRYGNAGTLKGSQIMSDYDIYVDVLKIPEDKAKEYVMRNKMQKIEDAKIQAMMANPEFLGVGQPGGGGTELGGEAGGPNPMLNPADPNAPPPAAPPGPPSDGAEDKDKDKKGLASGGTEGGPLGKSKTPDAQPLPDPTDEDLKKYDLLIKDYSTEKDEEEIDNAEVDD
jgi:intein/homing endonuclease